MTCYQMLNVKPLIHSLLSIYGVNRGLGENPLDKSSLNNG